MSNRVKEGYAMVAAGTEAYLISPVNDLYKYTLIDGLYYPTTKYASQAAYVVKPSGFSSGMVMMTTVMSNLK